MDAANLNLKHALPSERESAEWEICVLDDIFGNLRLPYLPTSQSKSDY